VLRMVQYDRDGDRERRAENSMRLSRALRNGRAAGSNFKAELEQPSAHIPLWLVREACRRVLTCKLSSQYVNCHPSRVSLECSLWIIPC